jgi:arginine repressor
MAKTSAKVGANKTELTRQYIAKHPSAGLKEVVVALKAQGVEISRSLASKIKYGPAAAKRTMKKGNRGKKQHAIAGERGSKAEAIRAAAKSLGKKVRPRDVIAMLNEQGITVTSAQVSTTLKSMGMRRTRRGGKGHVSTLAGKPPASSTHITIDDLIAAKKLVEHLGGIEQAKTAIGALARLS